MQAIDPEENYRSRSGRKFSVQAKTKIASADQEENVNAEETSITKSFKLLKIK